MARTRSIKPGFFDNEILGGLPPLTRLLFIGLWCQADREGRLEDRPRKLKKTILGYDDLTAENVDQMLSELHESGFIVRYRIEEERYIQVVNFKKHQNPHMKEKASEIPAPPGLEDGNPIHRAATSMEEGDTGPTPGRHQDDTGEEMPPDEEADEEPDPGEEPQPGEEPAPGKAPPLIERRFELFWKAYPKKRAKEAARRAFKKVKPDEELFNRILEAIGRARTSSEWRKENGQYIPNPATWLNGGCWDDEIEGVKDSGENIEHHSRGTGRRPAGPENTKGEADALRGFKPPEE